MTTTLAWEPTIANCDAYLGDRTGKYEWRAVRYRAAADIMTRVGLRDEDTVFDIGAGMTEFDYCLRTEYAWRGRYVPIDGGIDGTDLDLWSPIRKAEWFVALEILEHLRDPDRLINRMKEATRFGIVVSTPNPRTTDVLGMDPTHITPISLADLTSHGFHVAERSFYGQPNDSLFAYWIKEIS